MIFCFSDGFIMQVYLSLYTTVESMAEQVTKGAVGFSDSLSISGFKVVLRLVLMIVLSFSSNSLSLNWFISSARKVHIFFLNNSDLC